MTWCDVVWLGYGMVCCSVLLCIVVSCFVLHCPVLLCDVLSCVVVCGSLFGLLCLAVQVVLLCCVVCVDWLCVVVCCVVISVDLLCLYLSCVVLMCLDLSLLWVFCTAAKHTSRSLFISSGTSLSAMPFRRTVATVRIFGSFCSSVEAYCSAFPS